MAGSAGRGPSEQPVPRRLGGQPDVNAPCPVTGAGRAEAVAPLPANTTHAASGCWLLAMEARSGEAGFSPGEAFAALRNEQLRATLGELQAQAEAAKAAESRLAILAEQEATLISSLKALHQGIQDGQTRQNGIAAKLTEVVEQLAELQKRASMPAAPQGGSARSQSGGG